MPPTAARRTLARRLGRAGRKPAELLRRTALRFARQASNLFNKLWMLHKNPKLREYSASGAQVDVAVIKKAAKKRDFDAGIEAIRVELLRGDEKPKKGKTRKLGATSSTAAKVAPSSDSKIAPGP